MWCYHHRIKYNKIVPTLGIKNWVLTEHDSDDIRGFIQKYPDWVDNEISNKNKHSLRSNTKGYGGKTH
jgi:hypothetical protein